MLEARRAAVDKRGGRGSGGGVRNRGGSDELARSGGAHPPNGEAVGGYKAGRPVCPDRRAHDHADPHDRARPAIERLRAARCVSVVTWSILFTFELPWPRASSPRRTSAFSPRPPPRASPRVRRAGASAGFVPSPRPPFLPPLLPRLPASAPRPPPPAAAACPRSSRPARGGTPSAPMANEHELAVARLGLGLRVVGDYVGDAPCLASDGGLGRARAPSLPPPLGLGLRGGAGPPPGSRGGVPEGRGGDP